MKKILKNTKFNLKKTIIATMLVLSLLLGTIIFMKSGVISKAAPNPIGHDPEYEIKDNHVIRRPDYELPVVENIPDSYAIDQNETN